MAEFIFNVNLVAEFTFNVNLVASLDQAQDTAILSKLDALIQNDNKIMAALDDLKASVTRLSASTSAELKAIADKLASFGDSVTPADVAFAVASINQVSDTLDAETASLIPPPVVPPVTPPAVA